MTDFSTISSSQATTTQQALNRASLRNGGGNSPIDVAGMMRDAGAGPEPCARAVNSFLNPLPEGENK